MSTKTLHSLLALLLLAAQAFAQDVIHGRCVGVHDELDAQAQAGLDDSSLARAAVNEFLSAIKEEERQRWIAVVRSELCVRTPTIDVIVNAVLSQFKSRHHAEFL